MEHTSEELLAAFSKLPEDLQLAIWDLDIEGSIGDIGIGNHLQVDQMGILADHVALSIIGLEPVSDLAKNLIELGVSGEVINKIVGEVNQEIFLPIRDSMRQMEEAKASGEVRSEASKPADQNTVFEKKLGQLFRIPREEIDLDPYLEKPE